jgi:hypothetical protein
VTKDGQFVRELDDFSRVSGLAVGPGDVLFATDSESTDAIHPGWSRGILIGNIERRPSHDVHPPHATGRAEGAMGEGIAIDPKRESLHRGVHSLGITKFVREPNR